MSAIKKRIISGILGIALVFTLAACDDPDDGPNTTPPADSATTAPVGS